MMRALLLLIALTSLAAAEPPHVLRGSRSLALDRMERVGRAPADLALENITVVLGLRDRPGLDAVIAAQGDRRSPRYHRWLDAAEIADRFGPRRAEYDAVRRWLVEQGFTVVRESPFRLTLVVAGTAAQAEAAFATPMALFRRGNRVYHGPVGDPTVPAEMAGMIAGVIGLDDVPQFRPLALLANGDTALTPADFATAYDVAGLQTAGLTGAGHSIAVIARSDFLDSDIAAFSSRFLARPLAPVRVFTGSPPPGILPDEGEQIEVLLDTQWAGSLAPSAALNVMIGSKNGNVSEALEAAIANRAEGGPSGDVITISFGFCEPSAAPLVTQLFDYFYQVANAQGQTVLVASGDDGPEECLPDNNDVAVNGLASSPHAVAVGGTAFPLDADGNVPAGVPGETVWNDRFGASGGGQSAILAMPRYQLAAGLTGLGAGRLLPDVALAASPGSPGYVIVQDGAERVVGGTSASAPAFASVLALLNEHLSATRGVSGGLGQLVPDLYRLGSAGAPVFRDVTTGTNGGFAAGPGFDLATGWGAPLAGALADAIDGPARCEPLIDAVHPERGCLVPTGRGAHACGVEWLVDQDAFALAGQVPAVKQTCRDGDPVCDADGTTNGQCTLRVALCVNVFDFRLLKTNPSQRHYPLRCHPGKTRRLRLVAPGSRADDPVVAANRDSIRQAIGALPLPTGLSDACTATVPVIVPAGGVLPLRARVGGSLGSRSARLKLE
ncbi:MAG TPA: S53 family peptidase, partial [Candidatus Binatia bacterium]|nr:S53 family peptidase [Candidatus Binatia bacterium]